MRIALLINDRESREDLDRALATTGAAIDHCPTAEKALAEFAVVRYDLIVMHWQVHPGLKPEHPQIEGLVAAIQTSRLNRNALYWEVGLCVMDAIREEGSLNADTPVAVIFPDLGKTRFEAGDRLTADAVAADLATRQPATILAHMLTDDLAEKLLRLLPSR